MSTPSVVVTFRMPRKEWEEMKKLLGGPKTGKTPARQPSFGRFIKSAIRSQMAKRERDKRRRQKGSFLCETCRVIRTKSELTATENGLDGVVRSYCTYCIK